MFYSNTLLEKTAPLGQVWLAANIERKVTKQKILDANLSESARIIVEPTTVPLALRLTGQLLFGIVRIYSRQTRYLLDDCNDALLRIKMAFQSSANNDLPANLQTTSREANMIPDKITAMDDLTTLPSFDIENLLALENDFTATPRSRKGRANDRDINLQEDIDMSQFNQTQFGKDDGPALVNNDDLDLELDLGMDLDDPIEVGRKDHGPARAIEDDIFSEIGGDVIGKSARNDDTTAIRIADDDGDVMMGDDDFQLNPEDDTAMPNTINAAQRARISESPLSDIDAEQANELERTHNADMYEPQDDTIATVKASQRSRKRKIIAPDEQTMLTSAMIKEQQLHHDNILKPQVFLHRDPYLLALVSMQKNGGFVANAMEGRGFGWAPELQGMLSIDAIRRSSELKRKRDSGIADMETDEDQSRAKSPRLEVEEDDPFAIDGAGLGNETTNVGQTVLDIAGDEGIVMNNDEDGLNMSGFDDTTNALAAGVSTSAIDDGPVSAGTKHAVHLLRDIFGDESSTRSAVFQELLPERKTTKADATKMFFECLVLATKDAIKVEQIGDELGGPIRVQGKSALWGAWAEKGAAGGVETDDDAAAAAAAAETDRPESIADALPAVAVSA